MTVVIISHRLQKARYWALQPAFYAIYQKQLTPFHMKHGEGCIYFDRSEHPIEFRLQKRMMEDRGGKGAGRGRFVSHGIAQMPIHLSLKRDECISVSLKQIKLGLFRLHNAKRGSGKLVMIQRRYGVGYRVPTPFCLQMNDYSTSP